MITASVAVDTALLVLKIAFLVLLYLFIWRIVRTASRDLRLPQESFVLAPQQAAGLGLSARVQTGKLVVMRSPALEEGKVLPPDSATASIGRGPQNDDGRAAGGTHGCGTQAAPQRGCVPLRRAAVRDRGRDGGRAGRRDRVEGGGRGSGRPAGRRRRLAGRARRRADPGREPPRLRP